MRSPIRLASRSVLRLAGLDTIKFLQGLVTVNVFRLCPGQENPQASALYGAFLNRRGRVEHAAFLIPGESTDSTGCPDEIFLDCDSNSAEALRAHLIKHRLRAKVSVDDVSDDFGVIVRKHNHSIHDVTDASFFDDPRLDGLCQRAIVPNSVCESFDADETDVTAERVLLGVPDGADFSDTPLPLHLALHLLRSVDFDKGCYLGQELTARTHFTGVLRKRITPLAVGTDASTLNGALSDTNPLNALQNSVFQRSSVNDLRVGDRLFLAPGGKAAGVVTSVAGNCGLAVMKLQYLFGDPPSGVVGALLITEDGRPALPWKPHWWNDEAPGSPQSS